MSWTSLGYSDRDTGEEDFGFCMNPEELITVPCHTSCRGHMVHSIGPGLQLTISSLKGRPILIAVQYVQYCPWKR